MTADGASNKQTDRQTDRERDGQTDLDLTETHTKHVKDEML